MDFKFYTYYLPFDLYWQVVNVKFKVIYRILTQIMYNIKYSASFGSGCIVHLLRVNRIFSFNYNSEIFIQALLRRKNERKKLRMASYIRCKPLILFTFRCLTTSICFGDSCNRHRGTSDFRFYLKDQVNAR